MRAFEKVMFGLVDDARLLLGIRSPQQEDHARTLLANQLHGGIPYLPPTFSLVRVSFRLFNCKTCVEQ